MRLPWLACALALGACGPDPVDEPDEAPLDCDGGALYERVDGEVTERWCQDGAAADGPYVRFETAGAWVLRDGAFAQGQPAGTWTDWYASADVTEPTPSRVRAYVDGRVDGAETLYGPDGAVTAERAWRAGVPCGTWTQQDPLVTRVFPPCEAVSFADLDERDLVAPTDVDLWDGVCPGGTVAVDGEPEGGATDGRSRYCAQGDLPHGPSLRWWDDAREHPAEQGAWDQGVPRGAWRTFHPVPDDWGPVPSSAGEVDGVSTGTWRFWRADRTLERRVAYAAGVEHGAWVGYRASGLVEIEGTFDHGLEHGTWRTYHPEGTLALEQTWAQGLRHGPSIEHLASGAKVRERSWADGQLHGLETIWWENGHEQSETTWVAGLANGPTRGWYEDGRRAWDQVLVDGLAQGVGHTWWEADEALLFFGVTARVRATRTYVDGLAHGPTEDHYVDDADEPTAIARTGTAWHGDEEGLTTLYHRSGGKLAEGMFHASLPEGAWTTWYEGGALHEEVGWQNGFREGAYVEHHPNGAVRRTGTWRSGVRVGTWTTYDEQGNVVLVEECPVTTGGCPP